MPGGTAVLLHEASMNGSEPRDRAASRPFFIVGSQRSGSTMLRLMLNNHPRLAIPHESGFIIGTARNLAEFGDLAVRANRERLLDHIGRTVLVKRGGHIVDRAAILDTPATNLAEFVDAIFTVYAKSCGKARWGDKTPYYTPDLDILWTLFPGCQFIHIVRDGRDVAVSLRRIRWGSRSMIRLAQDWRWKTTIAHKVGVALGPDHYLELRYEDLVREPEANLRRVCDFLGEPFDPAVLNYSETAKDVVPGESLQWHRNSVRPPDPAKLFGWKRQMSAADRIIFQENAGDALALFGYELEPRRRSLAAQAKKLYYTLVRRW